MVNFFFVFFVNDSSVVVLRRHRHLFCSSHVFLRYAFTNIYPGSMLYVLVLLLAFQLLMLIPILHALHCNTMLFMAFDTWISERTIYLPNSNNTNSLSIIQCCCCYHASMISKSQILSKSQTTQVFQIVLLKFLRALIIALISKQEGSYTPTVIKVLLFKLLQIL